MIKPFLSVIIPAWNEAERLPLVLIDVDEHLARQEYSYEILVVDDGSSDGTGAIAERFVGAIQNLKVIRNSKHFGKGRAVRIGMLATRGAWRLLLPASGSVPLASCDALIARAAVANAGDAITGSCRTGHGRMRPRAPLPRLFARILANALSRAVLRVSARDVIPACLLVRGERAERLFSLARLDRWGIELETFAIMRRLGMPIEEIGIQCAWVPGSHVRARDYLQIFRDAFRIRWWMRNGRYNTNS